MRKIKIVLFAFHVLGKAGALFQQLAKLSVVRKAMFKPNHKSGSVQTSNFEPASSRWKQLPLYYSLAHHAIE
jgi:hypothetical protein